MSDPAAPSLFDDGKADDAMRTIGEVSAALAIKPHVLRYWEQQFAMLQPLKRSGGRRLYRPEDVRVAQAIDRLVNKEGYTLKGAARALAQDDDTPAAPASATGETPAIAPQLRAIRNRLAAALEV